MEPGGGAGPPPASRTSPLPGLALFRHPQDPGRSRREPGPPEAAAALCPILWQRLLGKPGAGGGNLGSHSLAVPPPSSVLRLVPRKFKYISLSQSRRLGREGQKEGMDKGDTSLGLTPSPLAEETLEDPTS